MRMWTAYEPRTPTSAEQRADQTVLVKDGFSWPALLIPLPWLLVNRLWLGTLIYVAIAGVAGLGGSLLPLNDQAGALLALIGNLYAGFEGNDLYRRKLLKRGFVHAGSVLARNRTEAELVFFEGRGAPDIVHATLAPMKTMPAGPSAACDVLGLFPRPEGLR